MTRHADTATYNALEEKHAGSLETLRSCPSLHIVDSDIGELTEGFDELPDPEEFDGSWDGLRLDATMRDEPVRFSRLRVHWQADATSPRFSGEYDVTPPGEILLQPADPAPPWLTDEFQIEFLSQLRPIDGAFSSSLGFVTYLRMAPGMNPLEVWFAAKENFAQPPYPAGYVKLDLDYRGYMEALLLTKGFHGWQFLFADVTFGGGEGTYVVEGVRRALDVLPRLFPEEDLTDLQRRLEARQ